MITNILENALRRWFWTDSMNIININKELDLDQPFFVFIYATFTNKEILNTEEEKINTGYDIKDTVLKLDLRTLNIIINMEIFTDVEVESYFSRDNFEGYENFDTATLEEKNNDFIKLHGHGISDLICAIHCFYNESGSVYTKQVFEPDTIIPMLTDLADRLKKKNPDASINTNLYLPKIKK